MPTVIGLDLGQAQDFSALALLQPAGDEAKTWNVPALRRWPLGTSYPEIIASVAKLVSALDKPTLVLDATGVGRAVCDMVRAAKLPVAELIAVTITGGHAVTHVGAGEWHVSKKDLVGAVQSVLQAKRLKVATALPEAGTLRRELENFRVKITAAITEVYEAWREGDHDDLVLATALALWYAERPRRQVQVAVMTMGDGGDGWRPVPW